MAEKVAAHLSPSSVLVSLMVQENARLGREQVL